MGRKRLSVDLNIGAISGSQVGHHRTLAYEKKLKTFNVTPENIQSALNKGLISAIAAEMLSLKLQGKTIQQIADIMCIKDETYTEERKVRTEMEKAEDVIKQHFAV